MRPRTDEARRRMTRDDRSLPLERNAARKLCHAVPLVAGYWAILGAKDRWCGIPSRKMHELILKLGGKITHIVETVQCIIFLWPSIVRRKCNVFKEPWIEILLLVYVAVSHQVTTVREQAVGTNCKPVARPGGLRIMVYGLLRLPWHL